jgi:hypothetical protein
MSAFADLDKLLHQDPDTHDFEESLTIYSDIYERFAASDISDLQRVWRSRPPFWLTNLRESLPEMPTTAPTNSRHAFWPLAWDMIYSERADAILLGLRLLSASSRGCEYRGRNGYSIFDLQLHEEQLAELAEIWKAHYSLRDDIKQLCIKAECAGDIRRILHLESWAQAKTMYPLPIEG